MFSISNLKNVSENENEYMDGLNIGSEQPAGVFEA